MDTHIQCTVDPGTMHGVRVLITAQLKVHISLWTAPKLNYK